MNSTAIHEQILAEEEKRNRIISIIGTIIVHALLLLLIWTMVFTGNPPLQEQAGIPVDFGTSDVGAGDIIPESATPIEQQQPNTPTPQQSTAVPVSSNDAADKNTLTQDDEDAPVVKTEKKKEDVKPTKEIAKEPVKEVKPTVVPAAPVEKKPELVKGATMGKPTGNNKPGSNGNDAPGTVGDKGVPWGSQSDHNFTGPNGTGDTPGGSGGGKYPVGYVLKGRSLVYKPKLTSDIQEMGTVVVTITVDKTGKVIATDCCSAKGTTTKSTALINKALEEAKKVKFDSNPDAPDQQQGTFTFTFRLE